MGDLWSSQGNAEGQKRGEPEMDARLHLSIVREAMGRGLVFRVPETGCVPDPENTGARSRKSQVESEEIGLTSPG